MPTLSIHGAVGADNSGEVFPERYTVEATNDVWDLPIWVFADGSTRTGFHGGFTVPDDYASGANLVVTWTSVATTGDWEIDFDYRAVGGNDSESLDQSGTQESVNANDTAPSAANERMKITIALTDGNFAAGDFVEFFFARDKSDAGDTIAAKVLLFDLEFEYVS